MLSALLEIFFVLLQLEDEDAVEIEDERSEAGGSLEVATASAAGEGGESTWEHSLHDHVPDTKTFRCTVLFLQMEHDLRGFKFRSFPLHHNCAMRCYDIASPPQLCDVML